MPRNTTLLMLARQCEINYNQNMKLVNFIKLIIIKARIVIAEQS